MALFWIAKEAYPVDTQFFNNRFINVYHNTTFNSIDFSDAETGETVGTIGGPPALPIGVVSQANLAAVPYIDYSIGKIVLVTDYNGSGDGCALIKYRTQFNNFNDWAVLSTENPASTGGTGTNPI
jgi:hypothetical protein